MTSKSISQAMKAIKNEQCSECRKKAKGLVYRGNTVKYYCKECLHDYMEQKEPQSQEEAAAS
jgi:uncharacterized Zn ribbon protein